MARDSVQQLRTVSFPPTAPLGVSTFKLLQIDSPLVTVPSYLFNGRILFSDGFAAIRISLDSISLATSTRFYRRGLAIASSKYRCNRNDRRYDLDVMFFEIAVRYYPFSAAECHGTLCIHRRRYTRRILLRQIACFPFLVAVKKCSINFPLAKLRRSWRVLRVCFYLRRFAFVSSSPRYSARVIFPFSLFPMSHHANMLKGGLDKTRSYPHGASR